MTPAHAQEYDRPEPSEWSEDEAADDEYSAEGDRAAPDQGDETAAADVEGKPDRQPSSEAEPAVDACVANVEDDRRHVESIDTAEPDRGGWRVSGVTSESRGFDCSVDPQGEVEDLTYQEEGGGYSGERG